MMSWLSASQRANAICVDWTF